jgi:hypothetical protein
VGCCAERNQDAKEVCSPPAEAQRAEPRPLDEIQKCFGNQNARTLGVRFSSPAVRGSCSSTAGIPSASRTSETQSHGGSKASLPSSETSHQANAKATMSKSSSAAGPRFFVPAGKCCSSKFAVEVFSGVAHWSKAMCAVGFAVQAWDVDYNAGCDVLNPVNLNKLLALIKNNKVEIMLFGLPCQSWTRARRDDGRGPGPLRDDSDFLLGLPNLSANDKHKVHTGNMLFFSTMRLIRECMKHNVPWILENPKTSRVWLNSQISHLVQKGARFAEAHYCQYKQPWKKATYFLSWRLPSLPTTLKLCQPSMGRCSATGRKHVILQGTDSNGAFLTLRAQPYPMQLCHDIAGVVFSDLI